MFVPVATVVLSGFQAPPTPPAAAKPALTICEQAITGALSTAATEICLGDEARKAAESLPPSAAGRAARLREAADHWRRGANAASDLALKARAVDALAAVFDEKHLNSPGEEEGAIRDLIAITPSDLAPMYRLSALEERLGLIDRAEDTLTSARRRQPDLLEPYHRLAQFYARRAGAMQSAAAVRAPAAEKAAEPDERGIYRIGGSLPQPRREGTPVYPADAKAVGVEGVVILDIVVSPEGAVTDARVLRSIPLLDAAAIKAVREWRYEPTIMNGQPVAVRQTVTVNFTTR